MGEYVEVSEQFYRDFIRWGNDNIEGFYYEPVMMADRTLLKDGDGNLLAYRNVGQNPSYHIRTYVMNMLIEN